MITRTDELLNVRVELTTGIVHGMVQSTFTDSTDGSSASSTRELQSAAVFGQTPTTNYLAAMLAVVNGARPAGDPLVTLAPVVAGP